MKIILESGFNVEIDPLYFLTLETDHESSFNIENSPRSVFNGVTF